MPVPRPCPRASAPATAPADYLSTNNVLLTFPPNTLTWSVSIPILNDGHVELNETVHVVFSDATNGVAGPLGTITIHDDDPATVTFASTNFNAIEGSGEAAITVVLNAASGLPVSVHYSATNGVATPGVDFEPVEGLLVFAPGQTSRTFTVPLINESLDEFSETVELKLHRPGARHRPASFLPLIRHALSDRQDS